MGLGTTVILQYQQPSWLPCIQMLRDSKVDVYATVNGRKGQLSDMVDYFSTTADSIRNDYEGFLNGIYIRNPGNDGFKTDWYPDAFSSIKTKGLKVGIEGYANKYNTETAQLVDLVITFKDNISNFNSKCGSSGIGVFCKNSKFSDTEIADLYSSIESGTLQRDVFAAIVMYVLEDEMELT